MTIGAAWKFTAPMSGTYQVSAHMLTGSVAWTAVDELSLAVFKGGVTYANLTNPRIQASNTYRVDLSGKPTTIKLLSGEYIDIRHYTDRGHTVANGLYVDIFRIGNY